MFNQNKSNYINTSNIEIQNKYTNNFKEIKTKIDEKDFKNKKGITNIENTKNNEKKE